jgi:hypothetical protein
VATIGRCFGWKRGAGGKLGSVSCEHLQSQARINYPLIERASIVWDY